GRGGGGAACVAVSRWVPGPAGTCSAGCARRPPAPRRSPLPRGPLRLVRIGRAQLPARHELTLAVPQHRHLGHDARRLIEQDLSRHVHARVELLEARERLEAEGRPPSVLALELLPLEAFALGLALLEIQRNRLLLAQLPHGGDLAHQ